MARNVRSAGALSRLRLPGAKRELSRYGGTLAVSTALRAGLLKRDLPCTRIRYSPNLDKTQGRLPSQPINPRRRLREQRGLLRLAVLRTDALEGVEDDLVAALALVRRKIAFEHGAVGAEGLEAGFDIRAPRRRQLFGRWRRRTFMEIE